MRKNIASVLIVALLSSACATTPTPKAAQKKPTNIKEWVDAQNRANRNAMVGALIGAFAGGVTARAMGGNVGRGAAAGALVGAAAGFAVGKRQDKIYAERDFAVRQAQYDSAQGYVARIEKVAFNPSRPKPGATATLYVRYMIIGPDPHERISVTMFRGLKYGEDYIMGAGPNEFVIPRGGGIVESTMDVVLPKKAPQGTYSVEALIEDPQNRFPATAGTGAVYIVASVNHQHAAAASR